MPRTALPKLHENKFSTDSVNGCAANIKTSDRDICRFELRLDKDVACRRPGCACSG